MAAIIPVTLQLYTVRDDAAKDFAATLAKVAEIGYKGVELAGFHGLTAAEVKKLLDDNGLIAAGAHVGLEALEKEFEATVADFSTLDVPFITVPYLAEERRQSLDDYKKLADLLSAFAAALKDQSGIGLAYHNHAFEFETFGGDTPAYDVLFDTADHELVKLEMDAFWVRKAGYDPIAYLNKYAGRVPMIHVKDMTADGDFAEVGEGTTDFAPIFEAAETVAGTQFYIVEQDRCTNHAPLESVAISFANLQKMGKA